MRRVPLSALALSCGVGSALVASPAEADHPAVRLVRLLEPFDRPHPLADEGGRVAVLGRLAAGQSAASFGMREVAPGIGAIRLTPLELETFGALHPELALSVGPGTRPQLDRVAKWIGKQEFEDASGPGLGKGRGVVVGVVDTGIDVTHPGFLDGAGRTRIRWLLTWGEPAGRHPELEAAYGCTDPAQAPCAVYSSEDIEAMLANDRAVPDDARDFVGHGTHVAGIAAGNGTSSFGEGPFHFGVAEEATLVVASPSVGGGFGDDQVLRATAFIFDRAAELGAPAVVNLSLGSDFGPHDGTSLLESGLASFVGDDKPGRAIVVAAGNSGSLFEIGGEGPAGIHTEVEVRDHAPVRAPIAVPDASKGDVYVWIRYREDDDLRVGLEGPDGTWISPISRGEDAGYDSGDGTTGAVVNDQPGESSIPEGANGAVVVWSGEWERGGEFAILLEGNGHAELWASAQGEASRSGAYFRHGQKSGSINTPASHPRLLAVGCTINRHTWRPVDSQAIELTQLGPDTDIVDDELCYFSTGGPNPNGVPKPELLAPGAFVASTMSTDADPRTHEGSMFDGSGCEEGSACYLTQDRYAMAVGTSMSAPVVAGAIALLMERDPTLTQARATEVLQAAARRPAAAIEPPSMMGAGAVDLRNALAVLEEEAMGGSAPDVGQSFWVLSAESVRPDPRWLVRGTVQLRRADGSVASGLDGGSLRVEVDGGLLQRPVLKESHGMFSFAVAGRRGSGGSVMKVRVTYAGEQIGEEVTLPIGVDPWASTGYEVDGGCAVVPGAPRAPASALWLAAAVAWAARARRRVARRA